MPEGNLVTNPGFEKTGSGVEIARGWIKNQWGGGHGGFTVRLDRTNSHTGDRSLVVSTNAADVHPGARTTLTAALVPGKYELRFWASSDVGKSADACAYFNGRQVLSASVGGDWKQFKTTVEVEEKKQRAPLRLYTTTQNVRVWFDDVEVEAVRAP